MKQTPEELARQIKDAQARQEQQDPAYAANRNKAARLMAAQAMRAATDLVVGTGVGTFLGYWLDQWLGTLPLFMIIMFFLGMAAGMLNLYRSQSGQGTKIGFKDLNKNDSETQKED